jgi:ribosomal protein L6P/L9E
MKYIFSQEQLVIPDDVKIHIRSRIVTVEGTRGEEAAPSTPMLRTTEGMN